MSKYLKTMAALEAALEEETTTEETLVEDLTEAIESQLHLVQEKKVEVLEATVPKIAATVPKDHAEKELQEHLIQTNQQAVRSKQQKIEDQEEAKRFLWIYNQSKFQYYVGIWIFLCIFSISVNFLLILHPIYQIS